MKHQLNQLSNASLVRVLELTQKLAAPFDLSQMLEEVLQAALEIMHADSGSVWLHNEEDETLEMHLPAIKPPIVVGAGEGLVGECLAKNEVINVRDCYTDPRFNPKIDRETGYKTESILSIPLIGFEGSLVGVLQLLNKDTGAFDSQDELLAGALAAQSAVALQRTRMTETQIAKERLDEEISLAKQIQFATLPDEMPDFEGYEFSSGFIPAEYTGGDLFDLVTLGNKVFILMGDATGHGFGPALSATQMQAMFRVAFRVGASLDDAYVHVNNQLAEDLPDNKFLTAFIGFLDPHNHRIRYHSGGQGPLLHFHAAENSCNWYPPTSFPVGIMEINESGTPQEIRLDPGDIFAVISDGVYEYQNAQGDEFGGERVGRIIQESKNSSTEEIKERLLRAVRQFGGKAEQLDDITIVLVKRKSA